jgi:hypothetical protein
MIDKANKKRYREDGATMLCGVSEVKHALCLRKCLSGGPADGGTSLSQLNISFTPVFSLPGVRRP